MRRCGGRLAVCVAALAASAVLGLKTEMKRVKKASPFYMAQRCASFP